jgi:replicative DNA helicase
MLEGVIDNIDLTSERHVCASFLEHGYKAWVDVSDILLSTSFIADTHQAFFTSVDYIFRTHGEIKLDWPTLLSGASAIGIKGFFEKKEEKNYLKELKNLHTELSSVKILGNKLRKLEVARNIRQEIQNADKELALVTGEEKLSDILGLIERPVGDLSQQLRGLDKNGPKLIFADVDKYLDYIENNPVKQIGISTGFNKWDESIGGGLIPGSVSMIGARMKHGKSFCADNIACNIINQGIPVLLMDGEMTEVQHFNRILARLSKVTINEIKTGQYVIDSYKKEKVRLAAKLIKTLPYHYLNISGQDFEETVAEMKRWILNVVKLNNSGKANPAVIILDYLKVMSEKSIGKNTQEYQRLGFMTTEFINLAIKYDIACLSFLQLNRDGIDGDESNTIAGSDRIAMHCSNISLFKPQSDEEMTELRAKGQPPYNRKLKVLFAREGEGHDDGDYININFDKKIGNITEGPTHFEIERNARSGNDGRIVTNDDPTIEY